MLNRSLYIFLMEENSSTTAFYLRPTTIAGRVDKEDLCGESDLFRSSQNSSLETSDAKINRLLPEYGLGSEIEFY